MENENFRKEVESANELMEEKQDILINRSKDLINSFDNFINNDFEIDSSLFQKRLIFFIYVIILHLNIYNIFYYKALKTFLIAYHKTIIMLILLF